MTTELRLTRLMALAFAACFLVPGANAADEAGTGALTAGAKFGAVIGSPASGLPDTLWAQGYGYLGAAPCSPGMQALMDCRSGAQILAFQPASLSRKGRVYFRIESGRIAAIAWDLRYVAVAEG